MREKKKIAVLLATDSLGKPDEALGQHIIVNFIMKMKEMKDDLWRHGEIYGVA